MKMLTAIVTIMITISPPSFQHNFTNDDQFSNLLSSHWCIQNQYTTPQKAQMYWYLENDNVRKL